MIKRTITYKDFDGKDVTEDLYFNLTQFEATELSIEMPEEISSEASNVKTNEDAIAAGNRILQKMSGKEIVDFVKKLVLKSYGIKSEDGKRFIKSDKISEEFSQTIAFSDFMMELMTNDEAVTTFVNGVIPSDLAAKIPNGIATSKIETTNK